MTSEQHIEEKRSELRAIVAQQKELIKKAAETANTNLPRALQLCFQANMLEHDKDIILSKPIPKYPAGAPRTGGTGVVGESIEGEMITMIDGRTFAIPSMPRMSPGTYLLDGRTIDIDEHKRS